MPLDMSRIQALCFDVDGTLRDTDDQYTSQLARLLRPLKFLFRGGDPTAFARRAVMALESPGTWLYSLPDRLGVDNKLGDLADWLQRATSREPIRRYAAVPGAVEAVQRLAERFPLAVVSARDDVHTRQFLELCGILPFFQAIATAATCKHTKPFPDPILWIAESLGLPAAACVMIGDTTVDIRAGKAAGAQTIGVLCGFGQENELRRAGADLILPSVVDVAAILLDDRRQTTDDR